MIAPFLASAQNTLSNAFERWYGDKYSMFIHFGLYSHLGGVWDGKPVTDGYSEQIQSFAGIFGDWYAMTADEFDPRSFDQKSLPYIQDANGESIHNLYDKHAYASDYQAIPPDGNSRYLQNPVLSYPATLHV